MSKSKVALGVIIGAAAGVVAGFLTAPKSGKETRADIKRKAHELKDDAADKIDQAKDKAGELAEKAGDVANDYKERTTRAFDSAKKEFQKPAKR